MTAGTVCGKGNGKLGPEVRDEVVCRVEARRACTANQASKKKRALRDLQKSVGIIRAKMAYVSFNLTLKDLTTLSVGGRRLKRTARCPQKGPNLKNFGRRLNITPCPMSVLKTPTQKRRTMMR
jgi:hypothetical protein